jgi:hypothetical protein
VKFDLAINDVQDAEMELAKELIALAERHHAESDVYDLSLARAHVCAEHVWRLRPFAERYDADVVDVEDATTPGFVDTLRHAAAGALSHAPASAVALLHDLRNAYAKAHATEISWIMLEQASRAARDLELLTVVCLALAETEQTGKWLKAKVKDSAAQALVVS